jgi:hypothetical protein
MCCGVKAVSEAKRSEHCAGCWRSGGSALGLIFAVVLVLSIAAAALHYQKIARFCADAELACRSH